jgi:diamine N-acetyltransferase
MTDHVEVTIRLAGVGYADSLAGLAARTFEDTFGPDNHPADTAAYLAANFTPARIGAELADELNRYLIAEVERRPAGYAKLRWSDAPPEVIAKRALSLTRIYVAQEWLGHGVGAALMQRCLDEARSMGADMLWLGVWERNARAIAFYEKWQFVKVGEQDFVLGSDRQTDWVMARPV